MQESLIFEAIAFAARAHRHQLRKDGVTPYVSHCFRVAMVVRHVFGIDDARVLAAAVLHDTIEDTTTDYDDLAAAFGTEIADWVACLTKEMRLPEAAREREYHARLATAQWPVVIGKLADIFDNLNDSKQLSAEARARTLLRCEEYLAVFRGHVPGEAIAAFAIVEKKLEALNSQPLVKK